MNIDYNKFNLSHELKMSFDGGKLVPILVQEVLPGDSFRIKPEVFIRCQPLIAPVMHRVDVFTYFFYVQNLNIWEDAQEFYTRGRDNDSVVTVPRIRVESGDKSLYATGELADYMGIPPIPSATTLTSYHYLNALPFLAYQNIYQEMFRPQEVEDEIVFSKSSADWTSGPDLAQLLAMRYRPWAKDYFTGAKTQAILNPDLNAYVPTQPITTEAAMYKSQSEVYGTTGASLLSTHTLTNQHTTDDGLYLSTTLEGVQLRNLEVPADQYMGIGIDIDDIRRVSAIQRWIEGMIRVGYRYPDYLRVTWRVVSKDARLDRPEYLGGSSTPLRISEVLNTSATTTEAQGEMAGHGIANGSGKTIKRTFTEHGWIIGLMCVIPKATYYQGMNKFWHKFDHMDYANPYLANLGAQTITADELYYDWAQTEAANTVDFAYQNRYAEYKQNLDRCAGDFRSTLSYWHFGREFAARPTMNTGFVSCVPKTSVFAATDDPYLAQIYFNMSVLRKLPVYANLKID